MLLCHPVCGSLGQRHWAAHIAGPATSLCLHIPICKVGAEEGTQHTVGLDVHTGRLSVQCGIQGFLGHDTVKQESPP